jgi:hypoxanthine phosphoribosyltransferase
MEEGALAVHTAVLLAKDKPRAEEVEADYVGFGIGDEFVVGYGLDYQGKYRNLPYVGVLKTSAIGEVTVYGKRTSCPTKMNQPSA